MDEDLWDFLNLIVPMSKTVSYFPLAPAIKFFRDSQKSYILVWDIGGRGRDLDHIHIPHGASEETNV